MIHVHRASRADLLVDALARLLADPVDHPEPDPFTNEIVAVHARGIERWIAQELSIRLGSSGSNDGVCAGVRFPFPGRVIASAVAAACGIDPEGDPWRPERLAWPLLQLFDEGDGSPHLSELYAHVGGAEAASAGRRLGAARRVADLYDRYAIHRPEMIRRWLRGDDVDGTGRPIDPTAAWQPELWRQLRRHVAVPSPAERLEQALVSLSAGITVPDLPKRVAMFGLTALPASYIAVLAALATTVDVHLFVLHPSPALWRKVGDLLGSGSRALPPRETDPTRELPANPLLSSWGRDSRELQIVLASVGGARDHHYATAEPPATMLQHLQAAIREDLRPPGIPQRGEDRRAALDATDHSLQVHACHGRTRQVEVLRDAICHLLAADRTLEPRDILVMCPDIETFAPLLHAVFGAQPGGDDALPDLRVRLADRSLRQTNALLRVAADLLVLADGRLAASEVLDFAGREPVRRRFRFDDDDLGRLESWVTDAGIRWGLDATHRAAFGLDGIAANTWRAGLDRLLLGVAVAEDEARLIGGCVPLDDVEGEAVSLAGRFTEFIDRLAAALESLRNPQPIAAWLGALGAAADAVATTSNLNRWQRVQLQRILDEVETEATADDKPSSVDLSLHEVRTLLDDRLKGRPSRASHRTGDLTVCTLVPMRSVPHRVVCLLGLDDEAFPRRTTPDGDDLLAADPVVGDRDARTEDRQLLLDAVLAARDCLVVTYTGRDERTNEPKPPAVPIGELLDAVDRTVRLPDGDRLPRTRVLFEHPLQPFDGRNFTDGGVVPGRRWGFDRVALAGALARATGHQAPRPFLVRPLAPIDESVVLLDDLVRFLEHPVKAFLRQRLDVVLPTAGDEPSDAIPVELSGLEGYDVGDRLLRARLDGTDAEQWLAVERARGTLPPGALADAVVGDIDAIVGAIVEAVGGHAGAAGGRGTVEVDVPLEDGRTLVGAIADACGDVLLSCRYARMAPKHRLAAWVHLVAATATHPDRPFSAITVGRAAANSKRSTISLCEIPPLGTTTGEREERATAALATLLGIRDDGLREPLPLYHRTSAAYAASRYSDNDALRDAAKAWTSSGPGGGEDRDPAHVLVLGGIVNFHALREEAPRPDESGPGWPEDEPTRFGRYARRLWDSVLAVEKLDTR